MTRLLASKTALASLAIMLAASPPGASADEGSAASDAAVRETLVALEQRSWAAWEGHDAKFFSRFLSDDHIEVGPRGITGKASVVAGVGSPVCKVSSYQLGEPKFARIAADSAVLVYRAEQATTCGGAPVPSPAWATSVYVYRSGRWLNVLYQQTPVGKP